MRKVLLIATYDSFLKTGLSVAKDIDDVEIDIQIRTTASNQLSKKQLLSIFNGEKYKYSFFFMDGYKKINYNDYEIIILSAGNSFIQSFFTFYLKERFIDREKIITISLFPGVIFGDIDSISSRMNVDVLLCNNEIDYNIAKSIQRVYNLNNDILIYGFPTFQKVENFSINRDKTYFFEQVKIPETYNDRFYLIKKLIEYAVNNHKESIYIKPRVSSNEKTVHINKYPIEKLLEEYKSKYQVFPNNLQITYKSIFECFKDMKLGITLSSTVAVEAIYNNLPMAIISDFGIRNDFANQDFLNSGCFVSFDELNKKELLVNKDWYNTRINFPKNRKYLLNKAILMSLNRKKSSFHIATQSIDYSYFKRKNYFEIYKKRIFKAIKNPKYTLSVLVNFIRSRV
jgi:hypothetical protein